MYIARGYSFYFSTTRGMLRDGDLFSMTEGGEKDRPEF